MEMWYLIVINALYKLHYQGWFLPQTELDYFVHLAWSDGLSEARGTECTCSHKSTSIFTSAVFNIAAWFHSIRVVIWKLLTNKYRDMDWVQLQLRQRISCVSKSDYVYKILLQLCHLLTYEHELAGQLIVLQYLDDLFGPPPRVLLPHRWL